MIAIVELKNNLSAREVGGKGYSLGILAKNNFDVPKGFVIISEAFFKFLKYNNLTERIEKLSSEIDRENFREKCKKIRNLILEGKIPKDLILEIKDNLKKLNSLRISIRSSAANEDSLKASFAGLHDTFLNINSKSDLILDYTKRCWASFFNERAATYRIKKGLPHLGGMAVIIQKMIPAEVSGVTFTVHPTNKNALLIEASYGLGDIIVSGEIEPDDYVVDRETLIIIDKKIGNKSKMSICQNEEIGVIEIKKELAKKQVLSDNKMEEVAQICQKVEKIFNYPQDIEWSISNNKLWLLQSRPITGAVR